MSILTFTWFWIQNCSLICREFLKLVLAWFKWSPTAREKTTCSPQLSQSNRTWDDGLTTLRHQVTMNHSDFDLQVSKCIRFFQLQTDSYRSVSVLLVNQKKMKSAQRHTVLINVHTHSRKRLCK